MIVVSMVSSQPDIWKLPIDGEPETTPRTVFGLRGRPVKCRHRFRQSGRERSRVSIGHGGHFQRMGFRDFRRRYASDHARVRSRNFNLQCRSGLHAGTLSISSNRQLGGHPMPHYGCMVSRTEAIRRRPQIYGVWVCRSGDGQWRLLLNFAGSSLSMDPELPVLAASRLLCEKRSRSYVGVCSMVQCCTR